jgi:hypothetical protein
MCGGTRGAEWLDQNGSGSLHLLSRPVQHCLAPYSPDLNPIEQAFPKLKVGFRKAGAPKHPRRSGPTVGGLLDAFSLAECRSYLANSGTSSSR